MKKTDLEAYLKGKLEKLEQSKKFYPWLAGEGETPGFHLSLKLPEEIEDSWKDILTWADFWNHPKTDRNGRPLWRIEEKKKLTKSFGRQTLPTRLIIDQPEDICTLLGLSAKAKRFREMLQDTERRRPELRDWLLRYFQRIDEESFYPAFLDIAEAIRKREKKEEGYLREWAIPGLDTKFLENHGFLLRSLWNTLYPEEEVHTMAELSDKLFVQPLPVPTICIRSLDETMTFCGVHSLFLSQEEIAHFRPPHHRLFITENKVNGFTFPEVKDSLILFGMGYGVLELAKEAPWLAEKEIYYWGDLDHDGFNILSRLRELLPEMQIHSFLMDRETLLAYVDKKIKDTGNTNSIPSHLTVSEKMAWKLIHDHGWRLEQERIPHDEVEWAVEQIADHDKP